MNRPMTVLLTNITLSGRTGTEIQIRNIALELLRQGHRPLVYSPELGPIAAELRNASIPVVSDLNNIEQTIDIVHGHHLPTTVAALARFAETPAIFVCHDFVAWHDEPPKLPSILRYVGVDEAVYDRLTLENGITPDKVHVLLNAVDINRFVPGPQLPARPRRALAFAKNQGHLDAITAACSQRGIHLDVIGQAVGRTHNMPECVLGDYDLVFASALSAMEAMACGRAVVICDGRGLAGMCDVARFAAWRRLNFGLRTLRKPLTPHTIGAEIDRYDAAHAAKVSEQLRAEGGMTAYVEQLTQLYEVVLREHRQAPHSASSLLRAIATHLQGWYPNAHGASPWQRERQLLLENIDELSFGVQCAPLDAPLSFGKEAASRWWKGVRGFSMPEDWGTWTDGSTAIALFRIGKPCMLQAELLLEPFLPDQSRSISVDVMANGVHLANWSFQGPDNVGLRLRHLSIPKDIIGVDGAIWLVFNINHTRSPKELGISDDPRALGIRLHELTLRPLKLQDGALDLHQ